MNKSEAINLLEGEGWTKADAMRALEVMNFNTNPDELTIRKVMSLFAGAELNKRQRLQAAQKGMVTKKTKEIEQKDKEYVTKIEQYKKVQKQEREKLEAEIQSLSSKNDTLEAKVKALNSQHHQLIEANEQIKKDNKALKNLVEQIRLKLAIDTKKLLHYEDSEIRRELVRLFKWTLG